MTPQQRADHARAYIAELHDLARALPDHHELKVLALHALVLDHAEPWILSRLDKPDRGLYADLLAGVLDLYAPLPTDQTTSADTATTPTEVAAP